MSTREISKLDGKNNLREYASAMKYQSLRISKRRVNVKLHFCDSTYQLNWEFDFSIRMETFLDTNKLQPIWQKNQKLQQHTV